MHIENEKSVLAALKSGDISAFNKIYSAYSRVLFLFLNEKLNDAEVSSDILQDIFISLWDKREYLNIEHSLKAYLFQSIRFKLIDHYRRGDVYKKYLAEQCHLSKEWICHPVDTIDVKNQLQMVMKRIENMPRRMKQIFVLNRIEHLSIDAISERLTISPQTVKNQLTKASNILKTVQKPGSFSLN